MSDKITNRFNIHLPGLFIFLIWSNVLQAQEKSEPRVVKNFSAYRQSVLTDSLEKMVELKTIVPDLIYDLRYATINNFLHRRLYQAGNRTYLRQPAAQALGNVQREFREKGFALKIWDAYRPYRVTVAMWEIVKDDRYVADPRKGSGHNRGIAVDLTLVDAVTGRELDMGTGFDNFSDTAHPNFAHLSTAILQNRQLLRSTMEKYGFKPLETEWWHFYWNDTHYELLDLDPKKFKKDLN